jgi:hypothetical protein
VPVSSALLRVIEVSLVRQRMSELLAAAVRLLTVAECGAVEYQRSTSKLVILCDGLRWRGMTGWPNDCLVRCVTLQASWRNEAG